MQNNPLFDEIGHHKPYVRGTGKSSKSLPAFATSN